MTASTRALRVADHAPPTQLDKKSSNLWPEDQEFSFSFCGKEPVKSDSIYNPQLERGKAYFWKVIVDDNAGGFVESETRQLTVQ